MCQTSNQEVAGSVLWSGTIPSLKLILKSFLPSFSPSAVSRRAVVCYWQKNGHWVVVNHLVGPSLPRKSMVRLTVCPDLTIAIYPYMWYLPIWMGDPDILPLLSLTQSGLKISQYWEIRPLWLSAIRGAKDYTATINLNGCEHKKLD